ncbi:MAG: hypothetical protein ACTSRE_14490 [Promethearchaeota archaeon]
MKQRTGSKAKKTNRKNFGKYDDLEAHEEIIFIKINNPEYIQEINEKRNKIKE